MGHAPNGDTYRFDRAYILDAPSMGFIGADPSDREVYILAATQVKDVNGNYVNYTYDASNRLKSILAKDGRNITLDYSGSSKLVSSATAAGKRWTYSYKQNRYRPDEFMPGFMQALRGEVLSKVTQPDGRYWTMDLEKMTASDAPVGRDHCQKWQHTSSITHPYGATGTFKMKDIEHRYVFASRIRRTENCLSGEPEAFSSFLTNPPAEYAWSIPKKT